MMRILLALALAATLASNATAEERKHKSAKPKSAGTLVKSNPCAAYGVGFVQLPGTSACIKVGGSIAVEGRVH